MSKENHDRINDLFTKKTRNWTPTALESIGCVLFAHFIDDVGTADICSGILSEDELQRAERFVKKNDARHFIERRAFRRYCASIALRRSQMLSQIVFNETDKGRPYILNRPDLWFSFSSCRLGFLGAFSSTHAIGVDIEDTTRTIESAELSQRYFSGSEAGFIDAVDNSVRNATFFRVWCLKEAALKSIGEGLPFGLDKFQFDPTADFRMKLAPDGYGGAQRFDTSLIEENNICASIVIRSL